jgi:hypothetical protein
MSDCHSTVALHQPIDEAPAARTAAATTRSEPDASRDNHSTGSGKGEEEGWVVGAMARTEPAEVGGRVLDESHHVPVTTTHRRLHDN